MGTTPRWVWEGEGPGEVIKGVLASAAAQALRGDFSVFETGTCALGWVAPRWAEP